MDELDVEKDSEKKENNSADNIFFSDTESAENGTSQELVSSSKKIIDILLEEIKEKNTQISNLQTLLNQQQQLSLADRNKIQELEAGIKEREEQQQNKKKRFFGLF